jgi:hypothetical protein
MAGSISAMAATSLRIALMSSPMAPTIASSRAWLALVRRIFLVAVPDRRGTGVFFVFT